MRIKLYQRAGGTLVSGAVKLDIPAIVLANHFCDDAADGRLNFSRAYGDGERPPHYREAQSPLLVGADLRGPDLILMGLVVIATCRRWRHVSHRQLVGGGCNSCKSDSHKPSGADGDDYEKSNED